MRAFNCLCAPSSTGAKYINHLFFSLEYHKRNLKWNMLQYTALFAVNLDFNCNTHQLVKKKKIFLYYFHLTLLVLTLNTPFLSHSSPVCFCHTSQLVFKTLHILFYPLHEFRDHLCPFKTIQWSPYFNCQR